MPVEGTRDDGYERAGAHREPHGPARRTLAGVRVRPQRVLRVTRNKRTSKHRVKRTIERYNLAFNPWNVIILLLTHFLNLIFLRR